MGPPDSLTRVIPAPACPAAGAGGAAILPRMGALSRPVEVRDEPCAIRLALPGERTLLESAFPYRALSRIAHADRRAVDPVYAAHRWWARRPAGVMRGLLLAASLPSDITAEEYWRLFASNLPVLKGLAVHDPFAGGGSALVEAGRLGATPSGSDLDPLAVAIVRHELERPDPKRVAAVAAALLGFLEQRVGHLFAGTRKGWTPLHYFYLYTVRCPGCRVESQLYRNLIIAVTSGKSGAVVRDSAITVFCPECLRVHQMDRLERRELRCCGRVKLTYATFSAQRFRCPACGHRALHRDLQTGMSPRYLLAIEETSPVDRRRIRAASNEDRALLAAASRYVASHMEELDIPEHEFDQTRLDARPRSFGITHPRDLFTARQLALFGHGFRWLRNLGCEEAVHRAVTLALSNALTTNNRLCGYATDYGRLAPLFSIRSYSLPALPVELNPFHPRAGRGTLRRSIEHVVRSCGDHVRRYVWSHKRSMPVTAEFTFTARADASAVQCHSAADDTSGERRGIDLCLFDPPYFDYIAYSELSEFYRAWLGTRTLPGRPLLPGGKDPARSFGRDLAASLSPTLLRLKPGRPLAFTFHSAAPEAWDAIGTALDEAELRVTALWPIRNDGHMGHHTFAGNCEWDIVVVCRRSSECTGWVPQVSVQDWKQGARPLHVSKVDQRCMSLAIGMARGRFGAVYGSGGF